jgi:hypothetical protein
VRSISRTDAAAVIVAETAVPLLRRTLLIRVLVGPLTSALAALRLDLVNDQTASRREDEPRGICELASSVEAVADHDQAIAKRHVHTALL